MILRIVSVGLCYLGLFCYIRVVSLIISAHPAGKSAAGIEEASTTGIVRFKTLSVDIVVERIAGTSVLSLREPYKVRFRKVERCICKTVRDNRGLSSRNGRVRPACTRAALALDRRNPVVFSQVVRRRESSIDPVLCVRDKLLLYSVAEFVHHIAVNFAILRRSAKNHMRRDQLIVIKPINILCKCAYRSLCCSCRNNDRAERLKSELKIH